MTGLGAVFRRELAAIFASPVAAVVATGFLLWNAVGWSTLVDAGARAARHALAEGAGTAPGPAEAIVEPALRGLAFALVLFVPFLSMRLLAEDRRSGADEIVSTLPLGTAAIVLGKWAAGLVALAAIVAPTFLPPLLLPGGGADPGQLAAGALGLALLGCAALALGLWASALTSSQPVAAVVALTLLLVLFLADQPFDGRLSAVSLGVAFAGFARGIVGLRDLVLLLAFTGGFLVLAGQTVEHRRRSE